MKELEFIKIINEQTNSSYLGDDCAFLKELGIVVTQDNFIENIHFKRSWSTPYQIGYKAAAINISDILASGARPEYITVGLSLPNDVDENFIRELYKGITKGAFGAKVIGGDITGADSIFISITAIGKTLGRRISSRSNAKPGYVVISTGEFGLSAKGLKDLQNGILNTKAVKTHLEPKLDFDFSQFISTNIHEDYAMMDTSDGLADSLFKIATASEVKIITEDIDGMFGAEDYKIVAAVPREFLNKLDDYKVLGSVEKFDGTYLQIGKQKYSNYNELNLYDHFGG